MGMNKLFCVVIGLVLLASTVFAVNSNSIQNFSLSWNEGTNQLGINAVCKAQANATLTLSNGSSREVICGSGFLGIPLGASWLLGDQGSTSEITGTLVIPSPCDSCSRTASVRINESGSSSDDSGIWLFLGIIAVIAIVVLAVINPLKPKQ